jgi:protein-disulfide isomerase
VAESIDADHEYGQTLGVSGTPAFFIGRIDGDRITDVTRIVGAQNFGTFKRRLEKLLN